MLVGDEEWLLRGLTCLVPLLLSLTVHEWAHAWSAWRLGDDTALRQGRLTLNPAAHVDPVGSLLLPLLGIPFGWAKPVPINVGRLRNGVSLRAGVMLTAAAGPLANFALAVVATVAMALLQRTALLGTGLEALLQLTVFINVLLGVFNLLPIPPLDGSRIVDGIVPDRLRGAWDAFAAYSPVALAAVVVLPHMLGVSLLDWPLVRTQQLLERLGLLIAG